jgi:3-dehydroquinate synthetase
MTVRGPGYPIAIERDVRDRVSAAMRGRRCIVLCDANYYVYRLAQQIARDGDAPFGVIPFVLGERNKRIATVERVWETLAENGCGRDCTVVGVGGGIASDLFGFAASTYVRGVPYVHVGTTLVAMADAVIGGKTAVNLRAGKNLAGTFSDPIAVYAHVAALQTLTFRELREGLAEIVKAAIVEGEDAFSPLERLAKRRFSLWPWPRLIATALRLKITLVTQDRRETGPRELLNLGHTFGHAFERASGYRITHGAGVALGLRASAMLAARRGMLSAGEYDRIVGLLAALDMPVRTSLEPQRVLDAMGADKKRRNGRLRFVLPRAIGDASYGEHVSRQEVLGVLAAMRS